MATQRYIGTQNGVIVCLNSVKEGISGQLWHSYSRDPVEFTDEFQALVKMEELFNELKFPFPGNNERSFTEPAERGRTAARKKRGQAAAAGKDLDQKLEKVMRDEELLSMHGDLGTFIIRVQHRQNSSWQGRITWVEKDKTLNFRSVWEMVKLIDNAMEEFRTDEEDQEQTW